MVELLLFSIPTIAYLAWHRNSLREAARVMGFARPRPKDLTLAVITALVLAALSWPIIRLIPPEVLSSPNIALPTITALSLVSTAARAAGEEILFRGFLQGLLGQRLGALPTIAIVSALFLLPHVPLLLVSWSLVGLVALQFVAGVGMCYLRHITGNIAAPTIVHVVLNVSQAFLL
ncbi:CPBP family intramembrane glutamic endopeptidase [Corynebacterium sp.]|uniref:CPBP family intramembrane glutamic endopeptidase n=1 Tax=Corynebacterium sp. TaxID=1720 RepID=UPI0026DC4184|nr:CPBP family intramembrane glutamic endopeptidase [Corynebacterium sp.]MDO5075746.1 CPBP family intramembrane metalloprotease [Corynebacterium sp.]